MRLLTSSALCLLVAACSTANSGATFAPDDASISDAGAEAEAAVFEDSGTPPPFTTDGGDSGGPKKQASSLDLEQVWFVTGAGTGTDFLIDFRNPAAAVVTCGGSVGVADGFEGTGVFTDPKTGDLLFYTDGRTVFNGKTNQALTNGTGLLGDQSATEPALITPANNGNPSAFYIFTNNTNVANPSSVYYSLIDLSLGANGTVTTKNQLVLNGNPGEALDVVPHTNAKDFWVLVYDGASTVKAYLVTSTGVSTTPVVSSTGLSGVVKRAAINHTLDYDHLALAINQGTGGLIATAGIDRATGIVSAAKTVVTGDLGYHASYSADGTKLYYVRGSEGWSGIAYQYDLTASVETMLGGAGMAAAKLAPDGKVYWAAYNSAFMAVVNTPNLAGASAKFVVQGLDLKGCHVAFGVPNQTAAYLEYLPPPVR